MFEGFLADALNRALGEYCVGIDSEKIRVSAWQGDVELRNVQLKKTALDALRAPIALDAGYIGSLRLKVPWTNLGEEAVVVEIDRVFLLASRVTLAEAERNAADAGLSTLERTRREVDERTKKLEEAELDWLRTSMGKMTKQMQEEAERKDSWMWKTFHTVLGNLQVKVTNVHFRYEDTLTTPNNPFACGLTIEKMSAVTVDDSGQPTFTTGGRWKEFTNTWRWRISRGIWIRASDLARGRRMRTGNLRTLTMSPSGGRSSVMDFPLRCRRRLGSTCVTRSLWNYCTTERGGRKRPRRASRGNFVIYASRIRG